MLCRPFIENSKKCLHFKEIYGTIFDCETRCSAVPGFGSKNVQFFKEVAT